MSQSTVSVTANPRRRPSAVSNPNKTLDLVTDASIPPKFDLNNNDVTHDGDDVSKGNNNKDLSHSIRGESILDRSKERKSSQLPSSNRTRQKKTTAASPRPRWKTVVSVLVKNLLLVVVLIGLVQMVRKLVVNSSSGSSNVDSLSGFSDMEGRIARVESSLKTTSKMLQVQVEVVDKKIESEVKSLRGEIGRKIEDRIGEFDEKLKVLEEKSEGFESNLNELRSKDVLSKDEFVKLYDELKKGEGNVGKFGLSLDEIRGLAKEIVDGEIEKHASDGLGRVDFALASGGGSVVGHSEPLYSGKFGSWSLSTSKSRVHSDASKMLMPSFGEPGHCFALKGSSGVVYIRLRATIVPEAITLEHVAKSVAYDRSSAPKHCRVSGLLAGDQNLETLDNLETFVLTDFVYDLEKSHAQTFDVLDKARSSVIDTVKFEFTSNHGSTTHTCIYRLRVHGYESKSVPAVPADS